MMFWGCDSRKVCFWKKLILLCKDTLKKLYGSKIQVKFGLFDSDIYIVSINLFQLNAVVMENMQMSEKHWHNYDWTPLLQKTLKKKIGNIFINIFTEKNADLSMKNILPCPALYKDIKFCQ